MEPAPPIASSSSMSSMSVLPLAEPGKSILKRAPPPAPRFFSISTLSKILPNAQHNEASAAPLKRAHFILPHLQTVYTISTATPPSTATLKEEKRSVELREAERRRTIVRGNSFLHDNDAWWSVDRVESFYRECCQGREEQPLPDLCAAIKVSGPPTKTRTIDLTGIHLDQHAASAFADILTVEWGLRKLVLKDCGLEELSLKPILHASLISNTLSFLSIASNKKLKPSAWRLLGVFIGKSSNLLFLDISSNILDKKSVEYLVVSFETSHLASNTIKSPIGPTTKPASDVTSQIAGKGCSLVSIRMDDCSLRPGALDVLAQSVRTSSLKNISLRQNRVSAPGGVSLALMIKDYPDAVNSFASGTAPSPPGTPLRTSFLDSNHNPAASDLINRLNGTLSPPPTSAGVPPRHPGSIKSQTTYTPYVPKSKRPPSAPATKTEFHGVNGVPLITSSAQGGVTTRHSTNTGPSAALLDNIRALDSLPRLGALRTLDLRGNDLKGGVSYLAQRLKRNRTLKVLNLSDNRIDTMGLLAVADALKYNSCLETLDISRNPCCGPGLEGLTSLRTAFTLNHSLKRLFLSGTGITSDGATALAEFLSESQSLYHLDLTHNPGLGMAGIVALNAGLKKNLVLRCLDLNIPPGDDEYARLCREILNTCVRNTEAAEDGLRQYGGVSDNTISGRGLGKGVWGMIEESVLAKSIREQDGREVSDGIAPAARKARKELERFLNPTTDQFEGKDSALQAAKETQRQLSEKILSVTSNSILEDLLSLNDTLTELISKVSTPTPRGDSASTRNSPILLEAATRDADAEEEEEEVLSPRLDKGKGRADPEPEIIEKILSSTFSITDSDDEESEKEDDSGPRVLTMGGMESVDSEAASPLGLPSPTERSRMLVEEEGEIFRKGQALLGPDELEGEFAGEQLRIELLEAEVERPPQRQITEETEDVVTDMERARMSSPVPPTPIVELPRPRMPRSRSASLDTLHQP